MRSVVALQDVTAALLVQLRRPPAPARTLLGFALGAAVVAVALPMLASVGIDFQSCPIGLQSFLARVVAVWLLAAVAVGLPLWLLALDPLPLTGIWLVLVILWKYGPFLSSLIPR